MITKSKGSQSVFLIFLYSVIEFKREVFVLSVKVISVKVISGSTQPGLLIRDSS